MSFKPQCLTAVFFIPQEREKLSIIKLLLQTAGLTDISAISATPSDRSGLVDCTWAGMTCKAYLDELSYHHLLQIYFWQSQFLEFLSEEESVPLDQDPSFPLAQAFKSAIAQELGFDLMTWGEAQETAYRQSGIWHLNILELRLMLFYQFRADYMSGYTYHERDDLVDSLLAALSKATDQPYQRI